MSETFSKNRIIKNSATLYVRMMFTMVVLSALGVLLNMPKTNGHYAIEALSQKTDGMQSDNTR